MSATLPAAPMEYSQLKQLARGLMAREPKQSTLTATALVHELYLKLFDRNVPVSDGVPVRSIRFAAQAMRQILVDRARSRRSRQRVESQHMRPQAGSPAPCESADEQAAEDLLLLEESLKLLAERFPQHAELVRIKIYSNSSLEEAAQALGMSRATAYRHWDFSKAWLAQRMSHVRN